MSELNTSSDVGPLGVSDEVMEGLDSEIDYSNIFRGILDDFFGLASEYQVMEILNLNDLSSISRCYRGLDFVLAHICVILQS